jgi:hypothetical protein
VFLFRGTLRSTVATHPGLRYFFNFNQVAHFNIDIIGDDEGSIFFLCLLPHASRSLMIIFSSSVQVLPVSFSVGEISGTRAWTGAFCLSLIERICSRCAQTNASAYECMCCMPAYPDSDASGPTRHEMQSTAVNRRRRSFHDAHLF